LNCFVFAIGKEYVHGLLQTASLLQYSKLLSSSSMITQPTPNLSIATLPNLSLH